MPRPAVIRLSWPGRISWTLPRLSRCSTSPATSQVTVCRPVCGCGPTPLPSHPASSCGPYASRKHQAPTMRRCRFGSVRVTANPRGPPSATGAPSSNSIVAGHAGPTSGSASKLLTDETLPPRSDKKSAGEGVRSEHPADRDLDDHPGGIRARDAVPDRVAAFPLGHRGRVVADHRGAFDGGPPGAVDLADGHPRLPGPHVPDVGGRARRDHPGQAG